MNNEKANKNLVGLLRSAYSGELAAAYAYRGHWGSVSDPAERVRIRQIEEEEWRHRKLVGEMLSQLGARPLCHRETRAAIVGRALGVLCHVVGWFLPMVAAGRLESRNVQEYVDASRYAEASGHPEFIACLMAMARVEAEHEAFFRGRAESHPWARFFPVRTSLSR